jgi:hypothetical protein
MVGPLALLKLSLIKGSLDSFFVSIIIVSILSALFLEEIILLFSSSFLLFKSILSFLFSAVSITLSFSIDLIVSTKSVSVLLFLFRIKF